MNSPIHVLVVEDNVSVAMVYGTWIKQFDEAQNISVELVSRYSDAVHAVEDGLEGKARTVNVVLLDLGLPSDPLLPHGSGMQVLHDMRDRWWELPIVIVTGAGDLESDAMRSGACDYLIKGSFSGKDLIHTIRKAWVRRDAMVHTRPVRQSIYEADAGLRETDSAIMRAEKAITSLSAKIEAGSSVTTTTTTTTTTSKNKKEK